MKAVIGFFKKKWVIQFIGVVALCVLIWFVGPLIAIAGKAILESAWVRGVTIAAIVVAWIIFRLLMQVRAGRKDQQLMTDLAAGVPGKSAEQQAGEEEVEHLQKTFEEALGELRNKLAKGKRGSQFLYELPWYVIIGAPGCGKTTALINSGLQFPLAVGDSKRPVKGVGGTRNCDWWFTDEAVLLDTAGRYTTQDSHQAVDAAAWQGFLGLLKKHRGRRPLNGVLVAVSLSDLLQQTEAERQLNAKAIRLRVAEIYQILGVRIPIYLMFTKSDLVAGFNDFFADLSQEDRAQVFGETFPAEDPKTPRDFLDSFDSAYDELLQRLDRHTFRRVYDERDIQRRTAILEYPQQMALLKPAAMELLRNSFGANRYETPVLLRGIYFTCGTQKGTPIDRVMGILASVFRLGPQAGQIYSGKGKSYFITRLLREVVFPEAELAGTDRKLERRQRFTEIGLYGGTALVAGLVITLWALSYGRNQLALSRVEEIIDRYRSVPTPGPDWFSHMQALLPKLKAIREAREVYQTGGWSMHMGLYQGNKIDSALNRVYEKLLQEGLLPLVKLSLEQRLSGTGQPANPDLLYELLRVYLMLGEPKRLEVEEDRISAENLIQVDAAGRFSSDPESLAEFRIHLDALMKSPPEALVLNDDLVSGVRARLTEVPKIVQAYKHFKADKLRDHSHDLRLGTVLGKGGNEAFATRSGGNVANITIPGLFTAEGYKAYFLTGGLKALETALKQDWVLGEERGIDPSEIEGMRLDFKKLYFADYAKTWAELLNNVQINKRGLANQNLRADILGTLSKRDSPLRAFLETVEKNTTLSRVSESVANELAKKLGIKADSGEADPSKQKLLDEAKKRAGLDEGAEDPVHDLERQFEPTNRLVRKIGDQPALLDDVLETLGELQSLALQQASGVGASPVAGGAGGGKAAARKLQDLPEPLKAELSELALSIDNDGANTFRDQLKRKLQTTVAAPCRTAFSGRYPFTGNTARETTLTDFSKFFAPNGIFDEFFQTNLKDIVDTARTEWRPLPGAQGVGLSRGTIASFQNAARVRDAFFPGGASAPSARFDLKPLFLDSTVARFTLNIEGQETKNEHGPETVSSFQWPGPTPNSGIRMVFRTLDGQDLASRTWQGPWALFRFLDEASLKSTGDPVRFNVTFQVGDHRAIYELRADSVQNPFNLGALRAFQCPAGL